MSKILAFFRKYFFNPKWKCINCGKEIFDGSAFCSDCKAKLPYNDGARCNHCGRKTTYSEDYCSTCKGILTSVDISRSVFNYEKPISTLIKKLKYYNGRYLADIFGEYIADIYFKEFFCADVITFVPMTKKAFRKRRFNQSELLAKKVSSIVNVPCLEIIKKAKDTKRQAKLGRKDRLNNLIDAFRIIDKTQVKDKTIVIVDDVSTTGSTAEAIGKRLKDAGAKYVIMLSVASVPPINGY